MFQKKMNCVEQSNTMFPKPSHWQPQATNRVNSIESRCAPRSWRSGPLWWREPLQGESNVGWLVESSGTGAAFLVRGISKPLAGTRIQTNHEERDKSSRDALVRRVESVHADLFLVAVQYANSRGNEA